MRNRRDSLGLIGGMAVALFAASSRQAAQAQTQTQARDKPIVLAMIRPETQLLGRWQRLIYRDAFGRLGREVVFTDYPAARASLELANGAVDGEGGRPLSYEASSPDIVRVRVPLFQVNYVAIARRNAHVTLAGWDSLADFKGIVAYKAGVYTTSTQLARVLKPAQLLALPDTERGLKMVAMGRCDLYVDEELSILSTLAQPELSQLPLAEAGVLGTPDVFCYLHRRHADLALRLGDVIAQMHKQGDVERYRKAVEKEFAVDRAKWVPD